MTKYQIVTPPTFFNELLDLPQRIQKAISQKVKVLERDPISAQGDAKKLRNRTPPLYRVRIGDYRLIYTVGTGWVKLITIRKRDDQTYQHEFGDIDLPVELPAAESSFKQQADSQSTNPPNAQTFSSPVPPASSLLPRQFTDDELQRWHIPEQYWPALREVKTEDELLAAAVPSPIIERIIDILYPRQIEEILQQPQFLLNEAEDLDRFAAGELTDFLLVLDPAQQRLVETPLDRPALVRGGPGTGKSIVALYRVKRLVDEGWSPILFTTYTNTLISYSTQLLERLLEGELADKGVEVNTVDSLIFRQYARACGTPKFASERDLLDALGAALATAPMPGATGAEQQRRRATLLTLGQEYLLDEFMNVIEHWGLSDLNAYLAHARSGRNISLRAASRAAVWAVYETWQTILRQNGLTTWGQVRQKALALAQQQPNRPYRAIVIDEAQDLSPVALRFLLACVDSPHAIYLTADANQSLYQRGFSWRQISNLLRLQGRSFVLRRNYRNTAQIAAACAAWSGNADKHLPTETTLSGDLPTVHFCRNSEEEAITIRDFFTVAARRWRLPAHAGAVLCHSKQVAQQICEQLQRIGMAAEVMEKRQVDLRKPVVKVMTIHSAKGLEFPFVAVLRLEQDHFPHSYHHLPVTEQAEMIAQERRLFYVGCSRAMRALLVCVAAERPSSFAQELTANLWQRIESS